MPVEDLEGGETVGFADDVFPALRRNCLPCHNTTKAKGGLNLESMEGMLAGGDSGPALVPGDPDDSLVFLLASHRYDSPMPPPKNKSNARNLTPRELGMLGRWIADGAKGGHAPEAGSPERWGGFASATGPVYQVALSHDGRLVAAALGNRVLVHHTADGTLAGELVDPDLPQDGPAAHLDFVQALVFTPSGELVSGGFRTVKVWRREGPERLARSAPQRGTPVPAAGSPVDTAALARLVRAVAVLPGGAVAAVGDDGTIRKPEPAGGDAPSKVVVLGVHPGPVAAAAGTWHGDGPAVATLGEDGTAVVWAADGSGELGRVGVGGGRADAFAAAAGAPRAALWREGGERVEVWDMGGGGRLPAVPIAAIEEEAAGTAERARTTAESLINHHRGRAEAAAKLAMERDDGLAVAKTEAAEAGAALAGAQDELAALEAAVASAEAAGAPDLEERKKALGAKSEDVARLGRESDGKTKDVGVAERLLGQAQADHAAHMAAQEEADRRVADAQARKAAAETAAREAVASGVEAIAFSADGRRLGVWRGDGAVLLWDADSGRGIEAIPPPDDRDGAGWKVASARRWDLVRTLGSTGSPQVFPDRVTALDVSPDGALLAAGSGVPSRSGELSVWDLASGERRWVQPDAHSDSINAVAFSPDGSQLASAGSDRMVKVFRAGDGDFVQRFEGHAAYVMGLGWRADGLRLASSGTDNSMRVWDLESGAAAGEPSDFRSGVSDVVYLGASDRVLAVTGEPALRAGNDVLFDAGDYLHDAAATPDGSIVATGGHDGVVRLFDAAAGTLLVEIVLGGGR